MSHSMLFKVHLSWRSKGNLMKFRLFNIRLKCWLQIIFLLLGQFEHLRGCQLPCQAHHGHREWLPQERGARHHLALVWFWQAGQLLRLFQVTGWREKRRSGTKHSGQILFILPSSCDRGIVWALQPNMWLECSGRRSCTCTLNPNSRTVGEVIYQARLMCLSPLTRLSVLCSGSFLCFDGVSPQCGVTLRTWKMSAETFFSVFPVGFFIITEEIQYSLFHRYFTLVIMFKK